MSLRRRTLGQGTDHGEELAVMVDPLSRRVRRVYVVEPEEPGLAAGAYGADHRRDTLEQPDLRARPPEWGRVGRERNSGWNCPATNHG